MKRKSLLIVSLLCVGAEIFGQDTYSNFTMTNTSDVIGSAKYVGMGGALGALGADISAISNNPAAIGLFRRSDVSITMGGIIQQATPASWDNKSWYSFDQIGFVIAMPSSSRSGVNFAMNLQKKMDATHSLTAGYEGLNGLSQAAQLRNIYFNYLTSDASLMSRSYAAMLYDIGPCPDPESGYPTTNIPENVYPEAWDNEFWKYSTGEIYGLDFNVSGNVDNRIFWGVTLGVDFLRYKFQSQYIEYRDGFANTNIADHSSHSQFGIQDYDLTSNKYVSGTGLNIKIGAIFRPIEESPFRIGLAIETPTWYTLTQKGTTYSFASKWRYDGLNPFSGEDMYTYLGASRYSNYDSPDDNYLRFNLYTPWRFRVSAATTIGTKFAVDAEYEYAMNNYLKMGYPKSYSWAGSASLSMHTDAAMTELTKRTLNGIHNARVGVEFKPISSLALRAGYNYFSSPMKKNAALDMSINSDVMNFMVGTDYMNYGDSHVFTAGLGYRSKIFYADIAYKYRYQHGDFYAFDDYAQTTTDVEPMFRWDNVTRLKATDVDLSRHTISVTIGAKF